MPNDNAPKESEHLTPAEMRDWLAQEIKDSARAHDLRVKEATEIVRAYTAGEISPEEAMEWNWRYQHRWQEALPGANAQMTDEEILSRIDKARRPYSSLRQIRENQAKRGGKGAQPPEASR